MSAPLDPIVATILIDAPIGHVWSVLTSEKTVPDWLGCMSYRAVVGTTFHMQPDPERRRRGDVAGATHCDVVALDPPLRFAFTWYVPGTPKTMVEISLHSDGSGTRVTLRHEGWDQFPADMVRAFHEQLSLGWSGSVLPNLRRAAEAG